MRSINSNKVEVLITLAVVTGGCSLAMVTAGIIIANHGKEFAISDTTTEYIYKFWKLLHETLNAVLLVLISLELLAINFLPN